jgi:Ca2+-binding EF-hand superfamily protein
VKDFDPVSEAFKCFDPENTGFVDIDTLKEMFAVRGNMNINHVQPN